MWLACAGLVVLVCMICLCLLCELLCVSFLIVCCYSSVCGFWLLFCCWYWFIVRSWLMFDCVQLPLILCLVYGGCIVICGLLFWLLFSLFGIRCVYYIWLY